MTRQIAIFGLCIFCLFSCASPQTIEETNPQSTETYTVVIEQKGLTEWDTSLERPWNDSTYVVRCTVSEIGEAYLRDGITLSPNETSGDLLTKLQGIRTPITITVNEVFKGDIAAGATLEIVENYGAIGGYYVSPRYAPLDLNGEYILFIVHSELWDIIAPIAQSTIKLNSTDLLPRIRGEKDFTSLANAPLFESYQNIDELIDDIRAMQ